LIIYAVFYLLKKQQRPFIEKNREKL
jgi:hypothetical protein